MTQEPENENYVVTARKWRPLQFKDVIGQEHIIITLQNAIRYKRQHHAYLFSGPRGVGKTTTARILARAINCTNPIDTEPCNECESCISILENRSLDVIEIDGASNNSVDDIRKLRENARFTPVNGKYKMYIIDEVHMLSTSAFNALLKTLEEPPPHLVFVFATTEVHKVPATILSRCQRFNFRRMEIDKITEQIKYIASKENITIDDESLMTIARKADGSMRDGQSIFDQVIAFCGKNITYSEMADALHLIDQDFFFNISDAIYNKNLNKMFEIANDVISKGYDIQETLIGLLEHFRNILAIKVSENSKLIEYSSAFTERYKQESQKYKKADLLRYMSLISKTEQEIRYSSQPRIRFEFVLIQLASMDSAIEITTLLDEIKNMKSGGNFNIPGNALNELKSKTTPYPQPKSENILMVSDNSKPDYVSKLIEKSTSAVSHSIGEQSQSQSINADTLQNSWNEFVEKYATSQTGLFMLKQLNTLPSFFNNEIVLNIKEKFIVENLNHRKVTLKDSLYEFYGKSINVKIFLDDGSGIEHEERLSHHDNNIKIEENNIINTNETIDKEMKTNTSSNTEKKNIDLSNKLPIEKAIIDIFGAEEINSNK